MKGPTRRTVLWTLAALVGVLALFVFSFAAGWLWGEPVLELLAGSSG